VRVCRAVLVAAWVLCSAVARAEEAPRRGLGLGVTLSTVVPSSGRARTVFGDAWTSVRFGPLSTSAPDRWRFDWDVAVLDNRRVGEALLVPLTFGATRGFGGSRGVRPFVAVRGGPFYGEVKADALGVRRTAIGADLNVSAGVVLADRFVLEVRYDWVSSFGRHNLSGMTLSAGVKLFTLRL